MKTVHWVIENKSGMHRVAESCVKAEKELGIDANLVNPQGLPASWDKSLRNFSL